MAESPDIVAFTATIGPSHAECVQQALSEARATLQRTRARDEFAFRERPAEVPGVPARSRGPAASCVRPADPPRPQTEHATDAAWWAAIDERIAQALAAEREAILEEITPSLRSLREMYEALAEQLAEARWQRLGTAFGTRRSAYRALKQWGDAERARIEEEGLERKRLQSEEDA